MTSTVRTSSSSAAHSVYPVAAALSQCQHCAHVFHMRKQQRSISCKTEGSRIHCFSKDSQTSRDFLGAFENRESSPGSSRFRVSRCQPKSTRKERTFELPER